MVETAFPLVKKKMNPRRASEKLQEMCYVLKEVVGSHGLGHFFVLSQAMQVKDKEFLSGL